MVQVKLLPTAQQAAALSATLSTCNQAADAASVVAFKEKAFSRNELQKLVYADLKAQFGLGAQAAVRTVKKVVDAYTTLRASVRAGNLGGPASKRRCKAEGKPIAFRSDAAQPYDDRLLSWRHDAGTVSIGERTGRGIALEDLGTIRDRVRPHQHQRAALSSWPFHQLGEHVAYKAARKGVPVLMVDAAYTSQTCPRCRHVSRRNRPSRDWFCCRRCGLAGPADVVAGVNVRNRARSAWAFVNMPQLEPTSKVA